QLKCFLCNAILDQRTDKNGKPYFVCDECGTQYFVRKPSGIERLNGITKKKQQPVKPPKWLADVEELRIESAGLHELDVISEEDGQWLANFQEELQDCLMEIEDYFATQR